jgi:hypothetical protein
MAPMETDAEAGGVSQPVTPELRSMPAGGKSTQTNSSSHGSAMRPFDGEKKARSLRPPCRVYARGGRGAGGGGYPDFMILAQWIRASQNAGSP